MIHLAELFFMMFPSKPSCSSGISSPATLTKENRTQISHSFYTRISTVSHFTWLNPPPPKKQRKQRKDIQGWGSLAKCSEEAGTFPPGHEWILIVLLYYNSIMEHGLYDVLWCSMFICMFIVLWYVHCWFSIETMVEYMFTVIVVAWSLTGFTHMYQCMYWPFRSYRPIGLQRFIIKVVYAVPPKKGENKFYSSVFFWRRCWQNSCKEALSDWLRCGGQACDFNMLKLLLPIIPQFIKWYWFNIYNYITWTYCS